MAGKVLVAYGTKHGSTEEVAKAIGKTLEELGLAAVVKPAVLVKRLEGYDGVVLGASIYMGHIHPDVRALLRHFHRELAGLQVAVFALGPLTMKPEDVSGSEKQLEHALAKVADVKPISTAIFGGVVKPEELHFPFSKMPATDERDWAAIAAWAKEVGGAFTLSHAALAV
jgi:menaquinone-dependent protoporphyrinogen oxidase